MKQSIAITWDQLGMPVHRSFEVEAGFLLPFSVVVNDDAVIPLRAAADKVKALLIATDVECELHISGRDIVLGPQQPLIYLAGGLTRLDSDIDGIGVTASQQCIIQVRAAVDL